MRIVKSFRRKLYNSNDILIHYFPLHSALAGWGKRLESHLSEWIVSHPDRYQDAIIKSIEAGCDIVSTSTQAASPWRAEVFGLRNKVHEFNYKSAKLAKEVTPKNIYVAGFISDTNPDFLEPLGNLTYKEVYDGYKEQILALLEGGVDILMFVGNHIDEKLIAIEVAKKITDLPIIAQNVFYKGKKGFRTMMGLDPTRASKRLQEAGVDVVGASCGLMKSEHDDYMYYEGTTELIKEMKKGCNKTLSIQPNAGLAQLVNGETIYPATSDEMVREAPNWISSGARIIGGCCGTSLEHYRKLSLLVKQLNKTIN